MINIWVTLGRFLTLIALLIKVENHDDVTYDVIIMSSGVQWTLIN